MLSVIQHITNRINGQKWTLGATLGHNFESKICDIISKQVAPLFSKGLRIVATPRSRDDGKDIIISSPVDIPSLLNCSFFLKGKSEIKIYVECKSSDTGPISLDKIICNVARVKEDKIDYFILVTNTSITPYTHYKMYNDLKMYNIELVIVDQYLLHKYLESQKEIIGEYKSLDFIPTIGAEYQTLKSVYNGCVSYEIYLSFRNYTNKTHYLSLKLLTDRNWSIDASAYSRFLNPYAGEVKKIKVIREYVDGIQDLIFKIVMGDKETQIHIQGNDLKPIFELPFIGQKRLELKDNIITALFKNKGIYFLYGDAGMGKTRIIQEVYKTLQGQNLDFGFFTLGSNNIIAKINNFLIQKGYQNEKYDDLFQLISRSKNSYRHAVLIIDDFHNTSQKLLLSLRELGVGYDSPVSIILCGRTDFSAGNSEYFSFAQWAIESNKIHSFHIDPLDMEETKRLIRIVINHVPNIVLNKLAEQSQNNPLFIVQYIEYMLETDLFTIVSRNTVGIQNIESFASQDYMPANIDKIYQARWAHLSKCAEAIDLENMLLLCVVNHGVLTNQQIIYFFNENMEALKVLLTRRFIQLGNDGNYSLIHESLFIFIKFQLQKSKKYQKRIANIILQKDLVYNTLNTLDKGMLALWNNNKKMALEYFTPIINVLYQIKNHSSINIDIEVYDYLYYIYDLLYKKPQSERIIKNIILARVYIALHYFTPQKAIQECNIALSLLKKNTTFKDKSLYYTLLEHQAHSYINAGQLNSGELILKKIQAVNLITPQIFSLDTIFDMYDKFCNIYIKKNCHELADIYNKLSISTADEKDDDNLRALAYISRAKIFFYSDHEQAKDNLIKADDILQKGASQRILCHNNVTKLIFDCVYTSENDWENMRNEADELLKIATENSFANSIIRLHLLLALCGFMQSNLDSDFKTCFYHISLGIDASIRFGIGTYIWQFYNLLAIIYIHQNYDSNEIMKLFETVFSILNRQGLLYIGNRDFCYGNLLAISNLAFFLQQNKMETYFYQKIGKINFMESISLCDYECSKPSCSYLCPNELSFLKRQYIRAQNKKILFYENKNQYCFRDPKTKYFIIIS